MGTGTYTGTHTSAYTGTYTGAYTSAHTGTYTGAYTSAYTGTYTGAYTSAYTGTYTGAYTSADACANPAGIDVSRRVYWSSPLRLLYKVVSLPEWCIYWTSITLPCWNAVRC